MNCKKFCMPKSLSQKFDLIFPGPSGVPVRRRSDILGVFRNLCEFYVRCKEKLLLIANKYNTRYHRI